MLLKLGMCYWRSICHRNVAHVQVCRKLLLTKRLPVRTFSSSNTNDDIRGFFDYLSTASESDLQTWRSLSKSQRDALILHRDLHKPLDSITDALHIKGIGKQTLNNFAAEFLGKDAVTDIFQGGSKKHQYHLKRNVIHPKYSSDQLPAAVVGCGVQLDAVYWARLTKDLTITHWDYCPLHDMQRKYDHVLFQEKMWQVTRKLPIGDLYLLEDSPIIVSNVALVGGALNRARLETLLTSLLNCRHNPDSPEPSIHRVHKLKPSEVGQHFGLLVGGERISTQQTVVDLCQGRSSRPCGEVYFPSDQLESFRNSRRAIKEQLSTCLLQTIMFYELLLQQDLAFSEHLEETTY